MSAIGKILVRSCPKKKKPESVSVLTPAISIKCWLRGPDLNWRPSGYEPDELPDCSTPHQHHIGFAPQGQINERCNSDSATDSYGSREVLHNQRSKVFLGTWGDSEGFWGTREGRKQPRKARSESKRDTAALLEGSILSERSVRQTKLNVMAACRTEASAGRHVFQKR